MCLVKAKEAFQEQAYSLKIATKDLQFSLVCGLRNVKCSATKITMTFAICLHCGSSQKHEYSLVPLAMRFQLLHFHNMCNSEQSLLYSVQSLTELNGLCSEQQIQFGTQVRGFFFMVTRENLQLF